MEASSAAYVPCETLLAEVTDSVLLVTFNRPDVRNAINRQVQLDLRAVLETARTDDAVVAVVLTGVLDPDDPSSDLKTVVGFGDLPTPGPSPTPDAQFPPGSTAPVTRIVIPDAEIDAQIVVKGVDAAGVMIAPDNAYDVAWYDFSASFLSYFSRKRSPQAVLIAGSRGAAATASRYAALASCTRSSARSARAPLASSRGSEVVSATDATRVRMRAASSRPSTSAPICQN